MLKQRLEHLETVYNDFTRVYTKGKKAKAKRQKELVDNAIKALHDYASDADCIIMSHHHTQIKINDAERSEKREKEREEFIEKIVYIIFMLIIGLICIVWFCIIPLICIFIL